MSLYARMLEWMSHRIAHLLQKEVRTYAPFAAYDQDTLRRILQPGDVLLIDGNQRLSVAIKYLTQSTWSHSALYIGDALGSPVADEEPRTLVEVELDGGCKASPLSRYAHSNVRICRPVGLTPEDRQTVVAFLVERIGTDYDMKNVIDLVRYLLATPPVVTRLRRRMFTLGSGEPTRAICSSLIAEAFQSVHYPILPAVETVERLGSGSSGYSREEIFYIRHHSLYTPRDFDLSPYFQIVKPTLAFGFDYKTLVWAEEVDEAAAPDRETAGMSAAPHEAVTAASKQESM